MSNIELKRMICGVDEVGRGTLAGPVVASAVILSANHKIEGLKDSKKLTSTVRVKLSKIIQKNALSIGIGIIDATIIDKINIRQATFSSMHKSIAGVLKKMYDSNNHSKVFLLIDGTDFKPYKRMKDDNLVVYEHECVKGGDAQYSNIAAASILAKVERDEYILDMCEKYPKLKEYYSLDSNKGYGAKIHLEGIKKYGITKWHRKSFGCCKTADIINIE